MKTALKFLAWLGMTQPETEPLPIRETGLPRYVLHPGIVRSKYDGQNHYVGIGRLANLYGVPMRECVVAHDRIRLMGLSDAQLDRMVHLYPREDGDYELRR